MLGSNPEPLIVTVVPTSPLPGENDEIVGAPGALTTLKDELLVTDPFVFVTVIVPLVAPVGTATESRDVVAEFTTAVVPLNLTVFCPGF